VESAPSPISNLQSLIATRLNKELREKPRYDQPGEAMEYYRLKRLPSGATEIPVEKYLAAKAQMDAMPQYSTAENRYLPSRNELKAARPEAAPEAIGTWTPLGPGNIGGRTRALLIHPTTPNVMYAAGVAGGVWKTTNAGALWQPLTDMMANIAISCLAFDPSNPNVIYAGTGEGFFNGDAVRGAGIFRTTDGGANWTQLTATGTRRTARAVVLCRQAASQLSNPGGHCRRLCDGDDHERPGGNLHERREHHGRHARLVCRESKWARRGGGFVAVCDRNHAAL
jgi:hypothetical protein